VSALRFRESLRVEVVDDKMLFLLNDEQASIVENPNTARVAKLIDGHRSMSDIMSVLAPTMSPDRILVELAKLQRSGHVLPVVEDSGPSRAYVESFGKRADGFHTRATAYDVAVMDLTDHDVTTALTSALASYRQIALRPIATVFEAGAADLVVVAVDDYLQAPLREINKHFKAEGQQWILVKPAGREVWVGPRFVAGATGCWESVSDRIAANRQLERYLAGKSGAGYPAVKPAGLAPGALGIAAGIVANEILALAADLPGELAGAMRSLDVKNYETRSHVLVDQPQFSEMVSRSCSPSERLRVQSSASSRSRPESSPPRVR